MTTGQWIRSGAPWIWLNSAAVGACILLVGGLILLIAARGVGHFWPARVFEFLVINESGEQVRINGQIRETERVPSDQSDDDLGNSGARRTRTRLLLKTANRDLTGQDFRWVLQDQILQQTAPLSLVVLERAEWGAFFGYAVGIKDDGVVLDSADVWGDFERKLELVSQLRIERDKLQKQEIGQINYQLEQLRLHERALQLAGSDDPEDLHRIERDRSALEQQYRLMEERLTNLNEAMGQYSLIAKSDLGDESYLELPLQSILGGWRPNDMGLMQRITHFFRQLWAFVSQDPREANTEGGIFPAIFGTILMVLLMTVFVTPLGVIAGIYLREYARQGLLTRTIRIAVNNLAGVPSIVYGVFGLGFFVYALGGSIDRLFFQAALPSPTFGTGGLLWASLTLALLTLPTVIVSTEEGLARIPKAMRESSLALGATQWETLWRTVVPMASPGIMTGVILAVARAAGEVAPLMLVGVVKLAPTLPLDGNFPFLHLERKFMHLGFHIYDVGFQSPNVEAARPLVYATALLLVAVILLLNIIAIHVRNNLRDKYQGLEA